MSLIRRTKIISLRLFDDEFERLRIASEVHGARSISDFARAALCNFSGPVDQLQEKMRQITDELQELRNEIHQLTDSLQTADKTRTWQ
jgi:uncharacterized protein YukE